MRFLLLFLLLAAISQGDPLRIMFVGAHPDDDSGATAWLASRVEEGATVSVVTFSRGESGGNATGKGSGEALGKLREAEERAALGSLGITRVHYLDCLDWGYTTSYSATAERWGKAKTLARLVRLVEEEKPDIIVTMNPFPSGHGNHQFAARLATEAYFKTSSPRRLLYALSYGQDGFVPDFVYTPTPSVAARELAALRKYVSQGWDTLPGVGPAFVLGPEAFYTAHVRPVNEFGEEDVQPPELSVELAPVPEVAEYRDWSLALGLTPLLEPPSATMVLGRPSVVRMEVINRTTSTRTVQVEVPRADGVTFAESSRKVKAPPGHTFVEFTGVAHRLGQLGPYQVLPYMTLGGPAQELSQLWEGKPSRISGRFWLSSDPEFLYLKVEVEDDAVVSQIDPGDASGHWRTDSVELTIDPSGRSQNTLSTFKLGMIAFARDGKPLAFRDADARPGPVPGLLVTSLRSPDGYVLEARIPRSEVGELAPEFGLNVLLYDADDTSAATGANINLSRVAWSAWPEVMGTPRLWGRARLEGSASDGSKPR